MTPQEDAIVIKISSSSLALYNNLENFLQTRQAYKYTDIPLKIKDFELFESVTTAERNNTRQVFVDIGVLVIGDGTQIAVMELADQDFVILWKGDIGLGEGVVIQSSKVIS